jgi:hypothetical protein
VLDILRRWRDEVGDTHALGAARVGLGVLLFANALRAARELKTGYFGDFFHWPVLPEVAGLRSQPLRALGHRTGASLGFCGRRA